jgi:hypothetical protein
MRDETESQEDSAARLNGRVPWVVTELRVLSGHRFHVRFIDGTEGEVDVSRLVFAEDAGVFVALRDPAVFAQAYVEEGVVTWPGELDLAPDAMYDEIRANGRWIVAP